MISAERAAELWSAAIIDSATGGQGMSDVLIFARAVEAEARREALEESAKVCDMIESGRYPDQNIASGVAWECADAIRALKDA